ncbi:MAG TPA: hypothetical protein VNZ45_05700 [Bacteroidia bacterium]|jgi:hypothetical protein|nr:hypothetical protein [Bacteroidia bacterium]
MKTLKSLAIAGMVLMAFQVSAQESNKVDANWPQKQTEQIKANVKGITPEQEGKILAIEQDFTKTVQTELNKSDEDSYSLQHKLPELRKERDAKLQAVLSVDQYTQYLQIFNTPQK